MKRLYKSRKNKMISGVCGGIAEYFDVDPTLVRILFIIFSIVWGTAILAYIIGAIVMPYRTGEEQEPERTNNHYDSTTSSTEIKPAKSGTGQLIFGVILVAVGAMVLLEKVYIFHNFFQWFWWHFDDYIIPAALIIIGGALMMRGSRKKSENQE